MSSKGYRQASFQPFESQSKTGRHIRITASMIKHPAWKSLKPIAAKLYMYLKLKYRGGEEISFKCTYSEITNEVGLGDSSIKSAFDDLISKGFIEVVENNRYRVQANLYKFSYKWQHYGAPEFEYCPKQRKVVIKKSLVPRQ